MFVGMIKVITIAIYVSLIIVSAHTKDRHAPIQIGSKYRFTLLQRPGDSIDYLRENDLLECEVVEFILHDPKVGDLYEVRSSNGNEFCAWNYELSCV